MSRTTQQSEARKAARIARARRDAAREIPGPANDPATNLVTADILVRAVSYIARDLIERRLLGRRYEEEVAREIVASRSLGQNLLRVGAARLATRSLPGAFAVTGGLLAKVAFDRARSRRNARRAGEARLLEQAGDGEAESEGDGEA